MTQSWKLKEQEPEPGFLGLDYEWCIKIKVLFSDVHIFCISIRLQPDFLDLRSYAIPVTLNTRLQGDLLASVTVFKLSQDMSTYSTEKISS